MSILSDRPDGMGFYYTLEPNGYRQINVRWEERSFKDVGMWVAYVGGTEIPYPPGGFHSKSQAEQAAISWAKSNPEPVEGDEG